MSEKKTIVDRIAMHGPAVRARLSPFFARAGVAYPPAEAVLVGIKASRMLDVWARERKGAPFRFIRRYPIRGASGALGPKLREGDRQVPEGVYQVIGLNPNSRFHLSLRLNYPNDFDWAMARRDGRMEPGSDIFIHGKHDSVGCLAMGDVAAEDLFVLAAATKPANVRVILTPVDFRVHALPADAAPGPPWADLLYDKVCAELAALG
ncbi:MAG: murein L,D-transpeptidase family protein [Candidatus Hydrogenedentota bacterium]